MKNPLYGQQCNPGAHGMDAPARTRITGLMTIRDSRTSSPPID